MTERPVVPAHGPRPALRCERLSPAAWAQRAGSASPPLGGLGWGLPAGDSDTGLAALDLRVLSPQGPCVDAWCGGAPLRRGRSGAAQWQDDGHWVFGSVELPDAESDLSDTARRAYLDIFTALRASGAPHLLRLWNYLPRINDDGGGLERYRRFNIGRQQAFIDAGHDAFEGAPAACALGTYGGGLRLRFLAGRNAPLPVENPRQVPAYRYSTRFGPRSPTFSRAALADAGSGRLALFVSGTASIVGEQTQHIGDIGAQVAETLRNLQAVVAAANARCTAAFTPADLICSVYVRHAGDTDAIRAAVAAGLGAGAHAAQAVQQAVYLGADICRNDLLVEIEGHAFAQGTLTP